jgi:hypothetical protein
MMPECTAQAGLGPELDLTRPATLEYAKAG